jgi:2-(1,2-epoxy-1,2-dihydrophenyl)acetyl-CoA isomerase
VFTERAIALLADADRRPLVDGEARLLLDVEDGLARITLNRPAVYNAIDLASARAFTAALGELEQTPSVRAVLLRGSGSAFCAGGDVGAMAGAADRQEYLRELASELHEGLVRLTGLPAPVVAAVEGVAAGAGLGLVLSADLVIAGRSARLSTAYDKIGLSPDSGVSYLLPRAVGLARALRLSLTGAVLTAEEAMGWGIVSEVVPDSTVADRAQEVALRLAAGPHPAVAETKRLLRTAYDRDYREQLAEEARTIARMGASDDAASLIDGFVARRLARSVNRDDR